MEGGIGVTGSRKKAVPRKQVQINLGLQPTSDREPPTPQAILSNCQAVFNGCVQVGNGATRQMFGHLVSGPVQTGWPTEK